VPTAAQTEEEHPLSLTGRAQITGDFYTLDATPNDVVSPRRPSSLVRFILTPTLSWRDLTLPFTLVLSSDQTNVTTPIAPHQSLAQFLQNPSNHIDFSPKYGWAQAHFGSYVPRYSDLSVGDIQLFGAGIDLKPGRFLLSAFAGTSQRAIEPDSAAGIVGAYARAMYVAKIGIGDRRTSYVDFNVVRMIDDTTSISAAPLGFVPPQEGMLGSLSLFTHLSDELSLKTEGAISLFTRDIRSKEFTGSDIDFLSGLMTVRESTRLDFGTTAELALDLNEVGVTAAVRYLGDGFVPLGFPYAQTDLLETRLSPRVRLLGNRLIVGGTIGYRVNNLSGTNLQTSTQILGTADLFVQATDDLSVSTTFSNFGVHNDVDNDTLKIRTVNRAFTITPSYILRAASVTHSISLSYSLNDYIDDNTVTGAVRTNRTQSVFGTYTATLNEIPLNGMVSLSHVDNDFGIGTLTINSVTIGASYRLFDRTLTPSVRAVYSQNDMEGFTPDSQLMLQTGISYKLPTGITLDLVGSINLYDYGSARNNASYNESFVRSSASMDF
jgi:hypothetical protein